MKGQFIFRTVLGLTALGLLCSCAPSATLANGIQRTPLTQTETRPAPRTASTPTLLVASKPNPSVITETSVRPSRSTGPIAQSQPSTERLAQAETRPVVRYAIPARYTASKGEGRAQGGQFDYLDESGKQLTDGILGGNDVLADLGRGRAKEWVAWGIAQPKIQFLFATPVRVQRVQIRFNRNDQAAIRLPSKVLVNGKIFLINPNKLPNKTSGYLSFEGPFSGRSISVQITRGRGWVFSDEVKFVASR